MLKEFVTGAGAAPWAIVSMIFFMLAFVGVVLRVWSMTSEEGVERAMIPLNDSLEETGRDVAQRGDHAQV